MKRIFQSLFALALFFGVAISAYADFSYPFAQIAKSSCRKEAWNTLKDDCKMPLPRIVGANYENYKNDSSMRRVYTVLWWATYDYGWDSGIGSHLGVDIATSAGTPVLSIGDGTVIKSAFSAGWGNFVTIKHVLADRTVIFSNYAHLSVLGVQVGDSVKQGQKIGEVGNTGNSYGNHLHFQIDITDQLHPYYYVTCASGKNELALVNQGNCRSYLLANTIDPILFLETGVLTAAPATAATITAIQEKPVIVIEQKSIKSRQQILDEEADEYLKLNSITVNIPANGISVALGKPLYFDVQSQDYSKNLAIKNLPGAGLKIMYDTKKADVFPNSVTILEWGKRMIAVTPKATGPVELKFVFGTKEVARKTIYVAAKGQAIAAKKIEIRAPKLAFLGQEYEAYISPLSEYGSYLWASDYREHFRLEVTKGKAKFCHVLPPKWSNCDPTQVVEMIEFTSADTRLGYYPTHIIPMDNAPVEIAVTAVGGTTALARSKITVQPPIGLDRRYLYYDTVISGLGKNWWKTRTGYVGQELSVTTEQVKELVTRVLARRMLKAGNDRSKKLSVRQNIELFAKYSNSMPEKTWSRWEFADLLLKSLRISTANRDPVWNDEKWPYQAAIATLRAIYKFRWQDQFGETYFQPDKSITIWEALYVIESVER